MWASSTFVTEHTYVEKTRLMINNQMTKILKTGELDDVAILNNNQLLKEADYFQYLGSIFSNDGGTEKDLASHIGKAASVFHSLQPVLYAAALSRITKLCLYMSVVLSTAIYTSEMYKITASMAYKPEIFHQRCL